MKRNTENDNGISAVPDHHAAENVGYSQIKISKAEGEALIKLFDVALKVGAFTTNHVEAVGHITKTIRTQLQEINGTFT